MEKILGKENLRCAAACMIDQLCVEAHENAKKHGFYDAYELSRKVLTHEDYPSCVEDGQRNMILAQFAKICSEVGEAVHCVQHGNQEDVGEELADVVIRVLDLAGFMDIALGAQIIEKMKKNEGRPYLHDEVGNPKGSQVGLMADRERANQGLARRAGLC